METLPNLVIGTSVSTQAEWDERVPVLCRIPAWRRVVSVEPCLGQVDITRDVGGNHPIVHGIILGGESGPGARPMHPEWARNLRDQCDAAGICFFMKQLDKKQPIPQDLMIRQLCWTRENEPWQQILIPFLAFP